MVLIETHLKKESSLIKNWNKKKLKKSLSPEDVKRYLIGEFPPLEDGIECEHKGCRNHISHPCDNCGRIGASSKLTKEYYEKN